MGTTVLFNFLSLLGIFRKTEKMPNQWSGISLPVIWHTIGLFAKSNLVLVRSAPNLRAFLLQIGQFYV